MTGMKYGLCVLTLTALMTPTGSRAADSTIERLRTCARIPNDATRLHCYDEQLRIHGKNDHQDLGLNGKLLHQELRRAGIASRRPDAFTAKVTRVEWSAYGKFVATLANGQVWAQEEPDEFPLAVGDSVTIHPGMLGALWMTVGARRVETLVQRIR